MFKIQDGSGDVEIYASIDEFGYFYVYGVAFESGGEYGYGSGEGYGYETGDGSGSGRSA